MKTAALIFSTVMVLGTYSWAGGCSDMAAFNTQIKKFLDMDSISETLKADVKELASECEIMHGAGQTVSNIGSCNDALKLIMVN